MTDDDARYVTDAFEHWIQAGYDGDGLLDELDERVADLVEGAVPAAFVSDLRRFVERGLLEQREREVSWTDPTTNDRIEEAFAELNDSGVVALENAGYTTSDGWSDCADAAAHVDDARGAVFFHGQDVERGVRGEGLLLAFGAFVKGPGHDEASVAIGREVCEVLAKYGVATEWDGTVRQRISIPPFPWQKRRFSEAP